jgi:acetyltransferase-like isoleucine patch superfamily enzyme
MRRNLRTFLQNYLKSLLYEDPVVKWRELGATIGERVFIGSDVFLDAGFAPLLTIEDGAVISARTMIILHDSAFNNVCGLPIRAGRVAIGESAYIGVGTIVLCGVTIGRRAIVGAGALVTKDIPDEVVAFGSPATVQGTLEEYQQRYREAVTRPNRLAYWDIKPWRERRLVMTSEEVKASRQAFLQNFEAHSQS